MSERVINAFLDGVRFVDVLPLAMRQKLNGPMHFNLTKKIRPIKNFNSHLQREVFF